MRFAGAAASVLGREAVRDLDARTIAGGTPSLDLMERAGRALAEGLADPGFHGIALPESPQLLVIAGRGNNGGDGHVVARLLAQRGWQCTVALANGEPSSSGDAAINLEAWRRAGGLVVGRGEAVADLAGGAAEYDLVLDALYGTGLARAVEGADAELIRYINDSGLPVVAADIPSGLCSDNGVPLGAAVRARATLTIGAAKPGLFLAEGPDHAGRVCVLDIGLDDPGVARAGVILDATTTAGSWPRLSALAHKGTRGHVLVVAGSRGKTGAAVLAARAALRAGAGLVTVAAVPDVRAAVAAALPEAMTSELAADADGRISVAAIDALAAAAESADAVVVGPGLGLAPGCDEAVAMLLALDVPVVVDADGLNAIAGWSADRRGTVFAARQAAGSPRPILTPHPGEMSRLVGDSTTRVQLSRKVFADNLAQELGAVLLLKGAATVVSSGMLTAFNLSGNPGMASAGMGDVLSGVCGAIAVRVCDPFEAACLAAWVHGRAGDVLAARMGPGFLASELSDEIPAVLATRWPQ